MSQPLPAPDDDPVLRWVQRCNDLARKIDETAASLSPSAVAAATRDARLRWLRAANGGADQGLPPLRPRPDDPEAASRYDILLTRLTTELAQDWRGWPVPSWDTLTPDMQHRYAELMPLPAI